MSAPVEYLPTPGRAVASGVLLATAVSASALGLADVVVPGAWRTEVVALVLLVTSVVVLARLGLRAWRGPDVGTATALVPTILGGLLATWLVLARFGAAEVTATTPTPFDPAVGRADVTNVLAQLRAVPDLLVAHTAPVDPFEPVVLLVVLGALVVLLLADVVVAVRVPALAGVAVGLLWLPPLLIVQGMALGPVLVTGLCLLGLLAVDDPYAIVRRYPAPGRDRWAQDRERALRTYGPRAVRWGALTAVTVAATLVLGATLPRVPGWGSVDAPDVRTGVGQVGENLDLARSLGERSQRKAYSYTLSAPAERGPLRTGTLYAFDGRTWEPHPSEARVVPDGTVLWPGTSLGAVRPPVVLTLRSDEMRGGALPVPLEPRTVERAGATTAYDEVRDVVTTTPDLATGDEATLTFHPRDLSADVLRAAYVPRDAADVPAADAASVALAFDLPATPGADELAAIASSIVADATTDYDRAVALQDHLRDGPSFRYTLEVPEQTSSDAVLDFLEDGRGYCVQFATAMATMARSLGMPARLAVGYLPGRLEGGRYVVRGRDAHAWPEIYFTGLGWVRFEPTPGTQSGLAPAYTAPEPEEQAPPTDEPTVATATPEATPSPRPTAPTAAPTAPRPGAPAADGTGSWLVAGVATLVLLGAATAALVLRRRSRARRDVEAAWRELLRRTRRAGLVPARGETTHAFAHRAGSPTGGIVALARAVDRARYAPGAPAPAAEEVARLERAALDEAARLRKAREGEGPQAGEEARAGEGSRADEVTAGTAPDDDATPSGAAAPRR